MELQNEKECIFMLFPRGGEKKEEKHTNHRSRLGSHKVID